VAEGKVAGYNMAGKNTEYAGGTNMSALKYFGIPVVSIGLANLKEENAYEVLVRHEPEKNLYKKIVLKDNVIMGITLVNDVERAGTLLHLMKNRVNVKKFKKDIITDNFTLAVLPAALRRTMCLGCA
jgi:NAD(P)H-nitrite reductase large subunit